MAANEGSTSRESMELRQFISKALEDIIGAVEDAQKATPKGCV